MILDWLKVSSVFSAHLGFTTEHCQLVHSPSYYKPPYHQSFLPTTQETGHYQPAHLPTSQSRPPSQPSRSQPTPYWPKVANLSELRP
ncbi:hypothetical protein DSO57_1018124 [Entomophthora muscae]|uniref:Uncharacterized protein n=1 Tax=Entomophthora muscae TaxID=34485 RepID=A0ACC2T4A2_9FUNG|nr:hypothetical protein DSO57_1018124 [Entomophthora muscae]